MTDEMDSKDLVERVRLIESMMAEGRRKTENWGWSFVLWGVAYYAAMAWATLGKSNLAWPVTMVAAALITAIGASRMAKGQPETTLSRAVGGVWRAMGISISVLLFSLSFAGRYEAHVFVAAFAAMLGMANLASAIVLRWTAQYACAVVWLACTVIASFGSDLATTAAILVTIFLCQIVFGIYAMTRDLRRRQSGAAHA
jgi:hypothetical protein